MEPGCLTLFTHGPDETIAVGRTLGELLRPGDVVALFGELGVGKTCLVQGIAKGLDVPESSYVRSPSFIILNIYPGRHPLYHLDLYRIRAPEELEDLGYREILYGQGVTVVEWADKLGGLLPEEHLGISLSFEEEDVRRFLFEPVGERYRERWGAFTRSLKDFVAG